MKRRWQKFTLLNLGALVGVFASLFMVPANTPTWLWAAIAGVVIAVLNYLLLAKLKKVERGESTKDTGLSTMVVVAGFLVFIFDLFFRLAGHSH